MRSPRLLDGVLMESWRMPGIEAIGLRTSSPAVTKMG
jgi:hypothetical protein